MSTVRDTFVIARRELLERVKSKWFVAMTILGPVFMIAMIVIPALIASKAVVGAKVDIVDQTGSLGEAVAAELRDMKWEPRIVPADTSRDELVRRIRESEINGFMTIPKDAIEGVFIFYEGDNASSQIVQLMLEERIRKIVQRERGKRAQIPNDKIETLLSPVNFRAELNTGTDKATSGLAAFFLGYILSFILYMVITLYGRAGGMKCR